jgi:hypothetical protein
MANYTGKGCFKRARLLKRWRYWSGALESPDDRIALAAATAILDRGYGRPTQSIDANISEETVRYYAEVPQPYASTEEWIKGNPVKY